jgi:hypothetical protein
MKTLSHYNDTVNVLTDITDLETGATEVLFFGAAPAVWVEADVTHSVHISFSDDVVVSLTPAAADALQDLIYAALVEVSA